MSRPPRDIGPRPPGAKPPPRARPAAKPVPGTAPAAPSPLLLLPMRIEYRVMRQGERAATEIWFRWYPDDVFAAEEVPAASPQELAARERFEAAVADAGAAWHDASSPPVAEAWYRFAAEVGAFRAIHLMRASGSAADAIADQTGRIVGLPERIALYALAGDRLEVLDPGGRVSPELRYTPRELHSKGWLTDFDQAVRRGMGLRLTDPAKVRTALGAEWIVAVGLRPGDASSDLARHVENAIADGRIGLLPQDTPTNNSDVERSGYEAWPLDPLAILERATYAERRPSGDEPTDADALGEALGLDRALLYRLLGAAQRDGAAAGAMASALLPGLTLGLGSVRLTDMGREAFVRMMARHAFARGPLPAVRIGQNPFGVLPIAIPTALEPPGSETPADARVFRFIRGMADASVKANREATAGVPVLRPDDPLAHEMLEDILQSAPVSKRVDVDDARGGVSDARRIGCPYVEGPGRMPAEYVKDLATKPLKELPDPSAADPSWPLLYRLLRLSREVVEQGGRDSLAEFSAALEDLAARPTEELEVLLLEVLDLLHYRADAWLTALATWRLGTQRKSQPSGLRLGYYSFIGKLRPGSSTGPGDGYLQAPSVAQAVTAGLLRSAARRFGASSSFNIDLASRRARAALKLLAQVRSGLTLREVLGYRAERWLHDRHRDLLIHELRERFPLTRGAGSDAARSDLVDGLALLETAPSDVSALPPALQSGVREVQAALANDFDALSDLVMAEAVHQLAMGNTAAANAWIKVLSGDAPPSDNPFLRTQREGQGSTHRVALLCDPVPGRNPRGIAEPALAGLARDALPGFDECRIRASIDDPARPEAAPLRQSIRLAADLGMEPVDLVLGGENEIVVRARWHLLRQWRGDPSFEGALGALPDRDLLAFLHLERRVRLDLGDSSPSATELLERAVPLRRLIAVGRPLVASDVNAAAAPVDEMDEDATAASLRASIDVLASRAEAIAARLGKLRAAFEAAVADVERDLDLGAVEALEDRLVDVSRFGLPSALRPRTVFEIRGSVDVFVEEMASLARALAGKQTGLEAARESARRTEAATRGELEGVLRELVTALQQAADGGAVPIWPPVAKTHATTPLLDPDRSVAAALGEWPRVRSNLTPALELESSLPGLRAWPASAAATGADTPTALGEDVRPRSMYYGVYLATSDPLARAELSGIVIDEWSEFRASAVQTTGVAINYDSPQSEPPHALLLGVAGRDDATDWSQETGAALVQEAIRLFQFRALPAREAAFAALGPSVFNVVPPVRAEPRGTASERIPTRSMRLAGALGQGLLNAFEPGVSEPTFTASALQERGFRRKKM